jgi:hypothetical protein
MERQTDKVRTIAYSRKYAKNKRKFHYSYVINIKNLFKLQFHPPILMISINIWTSSSKISKVMEKLIKYEHLKRDTRERIYENTRK